MWVSLTCLFFRLKVSESCNFYLFLIVTTVYPKGPIIIRLLRWESIVLPRVKGLVQGIAGRSHSQTRGSLRRGRKITDGRRRMSSVILHYRDENVRPSGENGSAKIRLRASARDGSLSFSLAHSLARSFAARNKDESAEVSHTKLG